MDDGPLRNMSIGLIVGISGTLGHCIAVITLGVVDGAAPARWVLSEVFALELQLSTVRALVLSPEPAQDQYQYVPFLCKQTFTTPKDGKDLEASSAQVAEGA